MPRALILSLDCIHWEQARSISFGVNGAIVDALRTHGFECLVVPVLAEIPSASHLSWMHYLRTVCRGTSFDQVWVWLGHTKLDEGTWEVLRAIAPVRVGFLMESMDCEPGVAAQDETLLRRSKLVESQLQHITHAVVVDELDVDRIRRERSLPAMWWPGTVPAKYMASKVPTPKYAQAAFFGTPYYARRAWLAHPSLAANLIKPSSPEAATNLVQQFDRANQSALRFLEHAIPRDGFVMADHAQKLHCIRREIFSLWVKSLGEWPVTVNLPTLCGCHASRVIEGVAAGRPVCTWAVPNRPKNNTLFVPQEEIILYPADNPDALAGAIEAFRRNPQLAAAVAAKALTKARHLHTTEKRIEQLLHWIDSGVDPRFD